MIHIFLFIGALILLYFYILKPSGYWSRKYVKTGKITPFFGDILPLFMGTHTFLELVKVWYNKVDNVRYLGLYQFKSPILLIKSPELIKKICVKDFSHFVDRRTIFPSEIHEFWTNNIFVLNGQKWQSMRSRLSPSFTSSKIKSMFVLICEHAESFVQHFLEKNVKIDEVDLKDALTRYTSDVIATTSFGLKIDSLVERENDFYKIGKKAMDSAFALMQIQFFFAHFQKLASFIGKIFVGKNTEYFMKYVKDLIEIREKQNNKNSQDLLARLIDKKNKGDDENFDDSEIAAILFLFFIAGFDSVSSTMSFVAYELALNPDAQRKLIEEIDANRTGSAPTYETITKMTYLDMVVSETLRMFPIAPGVDRVVTKPYTIQPELPGEKPVHLDVGDVVMAPINGLHNDPQYFPEPEKFDPERFSPENMKSMDPYTYLPFGVGPRNCIGNRFALLEIKTLLFYILSHFEIVPVEKTEIPIKIDINALDTTPKGAVYFGLKKRL